MLRRIIRRAVRHAYLLGAHDLVTPALVDATVEVMGAAYPEIVANHDVIEQGDPPRRGVVPRHAAARCRPARRPARGATSAARTRSSCTTRSASRSTSPARSRRERGRAVDPDGFESRMHEQRTARAPRPTKPVATAGVPRRAVPRARRRARPDRVHRARGIHDRPRPCSRCCRDGDRVGAGRTPARRSTSCSTARRSTPSPVARSATPARSRPTTVSSST